METEMPTATIVAGDPKSDEKPEVWLSAAYRSWMKKPPPREDDWEREGGTIKLSRKFAARIRADTDTGEPDAKAQEECIEIVTYDEQVARNKAKMAEMEAKIRRRLLGQTRPEALEKPEAPAHVTDARFEQCQQYEKNIFTKLDSTTEIDLDADALMDGEKVIAKIDVLELRGVAPLTKSGHGTVALTQLQSGNHRLHFSITGATAKFVVKERGTVSSKKNLTSTSTKQSVSNDYRIERTNDTFYTAMAVENDVYHCQLEFDDTAQLGAEFKADKSDAKQCDPCYYLKCCCYYWNCMCVRYHCCAACADCFTCCTCCASSMGTSLWAGSTSYTVDIDRELKTFTETNSTKHANPTAIEVKGLEPIEGTEQVAILCELMHTITIVHRSAVTNKPKAVEVIASKHESMANLVKFASSVQALASPPPSISKDMKPASWSMPVRLTPAQKARAILRKSRAAPFSGAMARN
jgi:hypothetical protein